MNDNRNQHDVSDELAIERELVSRLSQLKDREDESVDCWREIVASINTVDTRIKLAKARLAGTGNSSTRGQFLLLQKWQSLAAVWLITLTLLSYSGWLALSSDVSGSAEPLVNLPVKVYSGSSAELAQLESAKKEYQLARSALVAQLEMAGSKLDKNMLANIESNLIIIDQATDELQGLLENEPNNPHIQNLLYQTYQKELAFLQQLSWLMKAS